MRLIECKTMAHGIDGAGWRDAAIDLDRVTHIESVGGGERSEISNGYNDFMTDIPYEKAVELWENYQIDKGN